MPNLIDFITAEFPQAFMNHSQEHKDATATVEFDLYGVVCPITGWEIGLELEHKKVMYNVANRNLPNSSVEFTSELKIALDTFMRYWEEAMFLVENEEEN